MKLFKQKINLSVVPRWLIVTIFIVALIGFIDATYLTIEHYANTIPPCTTSGCETILTSAYAQFMGIPTSLFGVLYYLFIVIFLFLHFDTKKEIYLRIPLLISIIGFIFSIFFIYLMVFVLKAFCQYCAVSAVSSIIIFILSYWLLYLSRKEFNQL